jgi:hypothetical protein
MYRGAHRRGIPGAPFFIGAAIAILAMGIDGFGSYLGFFETTNFNRVLTGIMFGAAMGPVIYSILVESLAKYASPKKILTSGREVLVWFLAIPIGLGLVYLVGPLLGPLAAGLFADMIITTFVLLSLVLIGLLPRFARTVESWQDVVEPLLWSIPVGAGIIAACAALQAWAQKQLL